MKSTEAEEALVKGKKFVLPEHDNTAIAAEKCKGKGIIQDIGENRPYSTADSQPPSYSAIQLACNGVNCGIIFLANLDQFPALESIHYQTDSDFFI